MVEAGRWVIEFEIMMLFSSFDQAPLEGGEIGIGVGLLGSDRRSGCRLREQRPSGAVGRRGAEVGTLRGVGRRRVTRPPEWGDSRSCGRRPRVPGDGPRPLRFRRGGAQAV